MTPSKAGYAFSPSSRSVTLGPDAIAQVFVATVVPTYSIYGYAGVPGATVTAGGMSVTADGSGSFTISGLAAGTYTVTPSMSGYTFSPTSLSVTLGPNATMRFVATATSFSISGNAGIAGATVTAGGVSVTADASGNFTLPGLVAGTYTVTPSKAGYAFSPSSRSVTLGPNAIAQVFLATAVPTYSISGNTGISGATVSAGGVSATSDASGNYVLAGLVAGTYTVTPSKAGYTFSPASSSVTVGPNASGKNFTATAVPTYSISGNAGTVLAKVTVGSVSATSDVNGNYTINGLVAGSCTVTPSKPDYSFSPASMSVSLGPNTTGKNFAATYTHYTGNSVPSFGFTYIRDYQYASGASLTTPDGRTHFFPYINSNGSTWYPYIQILSNGCWENGFFRACTSGDCNQTGCFPTPISAHFLRIDSRFQNGAPQIYPGEITPDGWGLVPADPAIDHTYPIAGGTSAYWFGLMPTNVVPDPALLARQTSYFTNLPVEGGLQSNGCLDGGECHAIAPGINLEIWRAPDGSVAFSNFITRGFLVSGGIFDLFTSTIRVNHPDDGTASWTTGQLAMIQASLDFELNPKTTYGTGHSMGAEEVLGVCRVGWCTGGLQLAAVPGFVSSAALLSTPELPIKVFEGKNDWIANPGGMLNRAADGVNVQQIDTGTGFISPHNWDNYVPALDPTPGQ